MTELSRDVSVDEITPGLFIGNMACAESERTLKQLRITAVVSVVSKYRKPFPKPSITYGPVGHRPHPLEKLYDLKDRVVIYVDDTRSENIFRHFECACEFVEYHLHHMQKKDGRLLVHCTLGMSRSATIVAAYIMWKWRFRASQALQHIKKIRGMASPNVGFIDQLLLWEDLRCNPWLSRRFRIRPQAYYEMTSRLEKYKRISEVEKAMKNASDEDNTRASHRTKGGARVHRVEEGNTIRYCTRAKR